MPAKAGAHRRGSYQTDAAKVRARAYADPDTRCRRCGLTLADKPGDTWDAGHVVDGVPGSALAPEHSSCNRSAGAAAGNRRRRGLSPTRDW
jgi:hypothetical protein